MEYLKVELYNTGLKLNIEDLTVEISTQNAIEVTKQLNCDEIFDAMNGNISSKQIKKRVLDDYPDQFENLLHEFFTQKSDSNKYLAAEQQEEMEEEFYEFIHNYNQKQYENTSN